MSLPAQSKTTSLRGGYLQECLLENYETARNLDPGFAGPDRDFRGHPLVRARARCSSVSATAMMRRSNGVPHIWGGGRSLIDRPFYLVLNSNQQFARLAQTVADRVNETFHGSTQSGLGDLAVAKTKAVVYLRVPPQYQLNQQRYLRVVRLIPLRRT